MGCRDLELGSRGDVGLAYWQRRVFIVAWVTYASFYLTRLNLSAVLPQIRAEFGYSKLALGLISSGFAVAYALGEVANGVLVKRVGSRRLVSTGLLASALVNLFFGFTDLFYAMVLLWALNGYFQSTGWPSMIQILAEWFPMKRIGGVTGLFGSCFLVGSIFSWLLAGFITGNYGWRFTFWVPSLLVLLFILLFHKGVRDRPESIGQTLGYQEVKGLSAMTPRRASMVKVGVVAAAFTLNTFIRSGFTLWAPTFILETHGVPLGVATWAASMLPLGGVLGSFAAGWVTDTYLASRRAPVAVTMLASLGLLLTLFYQASSMDWLTSLFLLATAGFLLYGPHVLMVTTIPIDYASKQGAGVLAGIIDGIAYIGVAFADSFTGWLVDAGGWDAAVTFWVASAFAAALLMLTLWRDRPVKKI